MRDVDIRQREPLPSARQHSLIECKICLNACEGRTPVLQMLRSTVCTLLGWHNTHTGGPTLAHGNDCEGMSMVCSLPQLLRLLGTST